MSLSEDLSARGIAIQEQFLCAAQVVELIECLDARRARGNFDAARIGTGDGLQLRADIRGDSICWLSTPLYPAETQLLQSLERLRLELNRDALLGLFELELHYAAYPPGAGYLRHVDQPSGRDRRKLSLVLYLNLDWNCVDGGELRIFDDHDGFLAVQPAAGRLVLFLTEGREHCVLPARRERLSVTGWFSVRPTM